MTRRNIFRLFTCAVATSAMEVMGWTGVEKWKPTLKKTEIDRIFMEEAARMLGNIQDVTRQRSAFSLLLNKPLPENIGYSFESRMT